MRPRAITGIGVASAVGVGRRAFFEGLKQGAPARPEHGRLEVPAFDPAAHLGDKGLRTLDRLTKLLVVATRLALHDARLKTDGAWTTSADAKGIAGDKVGFVGSNAYGSLEAITELDRVALLEDRRYINPQRFPLTVANSASGYASIWEDLRAVNVSVSNGNCGGLDAFACADSLLAQARAAALVVGGAEAMSDALALAFERTGLLREGVVLGEGAALVVLEPAGKARARGAEILAEVVGYGTAFAPPERDSSLLTPADGAMELAVRTALEDAGVAPEAADVVVSGASGLRAFDEAELTGLSRALGAAQPPVVAPKMALGETLGAGGALGVLCAVSLFQGGAAGPVLRGTLRTAGGRPRTILVTALGYYGNASALVIRAASR